MDLVAYLRNDRYPILGRTLNFWAQFSIEKGVLLDGKCGVSLYVFSNC